MEAAYIGSANASIRSTEVPNCRIASSGDNMEIIQGARRYMQAPLTAITSIPKQVAIQPSRFVRSCLPAPTLCPISVVAAEPIPYPGI